MKHVHALLFALLLGSCANSAGVEDDAPDASVVSTTCDVTADCPDDGLYCNGGVVCRDHACIDTDAPNCADGINCTVDQCNEELLGCINVPHDELCDEGFACLDGEGCGVPPACEFTNDCSDDAFLCNGAPECMDGACIDVAIDCVDGDACTEDRCAEPGGCENNPYDFTSDVDHCTSACTPCPSPTPAQVHVDRACSSSVCGFVCQAGYWNVNGNMADGCEVACGSDPTTTVDIPDDGFLDQNCDGIDGTASDGIFVAEDGSNANPGTMAFPVKSIGTGLTKAIAGAKHYVYISAGDYAETVTLDTTNQGIHLIGGYLRSSAWLRDGTRGTITGPRTGALRVNSVTTLTTVEYLKFVGAAATVSSTSSHAIVVVSSTGFRPRYLTATAGDGANGVQGSSAGSVGDDGGDGQQGAAGYEDDGYIYCEGSGSNTPPDRYDGGATCTGATSSTRGGDGRRGCKTNSSSGCAGLDADDGSPNPAGAYSDGGDGVNSSTGGYGHAGQDGATGTNGSAGAGGTISGNAWVPRNGGNGLRGVDGSGGGGGAGGGSDHSTGTCNDWGGGGGGGGGGGCGGTPGDGGTGGGGSIAILLINSTITAVYVDTVTNDGGTGGNGRAGGAGGLGGLGKGGGSGYDESSNGGPGGDGGDGGRGGHGAGGAGGWTVGVYRSGSTWTDGGTTGFTPIGAVGNGGTSSGNGGTAGSVYDVF